MATDSKPIDTVDFVASRNPYKRRIRKVDWLKILAVLDEKPGEWGLVGQFDQSVRSHINTGRYAYIDPALYEAVSEHVPNAPRNQAYIFVRRRENT